MELTRLVRGVREVRGVLALALAAAIFMASITVVLTAAQSGPAPAAAPPAAVAHPRVTNSRLPPHQYRVACHNDRAKTAGVSFQGHDRRERRAACRTVREGRAQDARTGDAAAGGASARQATVDALSPGSRARWIARPARRTCATRSSCIASIARNTRTRCAICSPWISTRSPCCRQTTRGGLRQHRRSAAGVAVVHRAIRDCRAARRGEGDGPARCASRRLDVPRRPRHAAHTRHGPPAWHARAASSRTSISHPTANTSSTSPTWPPTSGATGWSSRTR